MKNLKLDEAEAGSQRASNWMQLRICSCLVWNGMPVKGSPRNVLNTRQVALFLKAIHRDLLHSPMI